MPLEDIVISEEILEFIEQKDHDMYAIAFAETGDKYVDHVDGEYVIKTYKGTERSFLPMIKVRVKPALPRFYVQEMFGDFSVYYVIRDRERDDNYVRGNVYYLDRHRADRRAYMLNS